MKIIACYNMKGGVGKTAATVNLSHCAAQSGHRVLVWDLDPQGAASFYFRIKPKVKGGGKKLVKGKSDIDALIKGTDYENLDLLPADFSYRKMDLILDSSKNSTTQLRAVLKPLSDEYDFIFIDCPPSISLITESIFKTADALLVPVIPTTLSVRTFDQLVEFRGSTGRKKQNVMPFFSMVDRRKTLHREILMSLPEDYPDVLRTPIPFASAIERMGVEREPVTAFAPRTAAAKAFQELWNEVSTKLG